MRRKPGSEEARERADFTSESLDHAVDFLLQARTARS
jgi:hypothetical protein